MLIVGTKHDRSSMADVKTWPDSAYFKNVVQRTEMLSLEKEERRESDNWMGISQNQAYVTQIDIIVTFSNEEVPIKC